MSVMQTLLVFAGIPLAVVVLVAIAVYGRSAVHQPNRYRPGKPWPYAASWYVPHPEAIADAVPERFAIGGQESAVAVAAGGASGEW